GVAAGEVAALHKNQPATVEKLLLGKIPANDADSPTLKGLRNTGRFMRTGVSIELATNLGQGGIDSPGKALRYGRDFIRQQFLDLPQGAAQEVSDAFFDGAEPLLNGGKGVMLEVDINRNYPRWLMEEYELPLPDGTRENLPSFPGFFGDLDECLCRPCESMLGLPAYLVDLLNLLAKSSGKGGNALDVLRARRPDIFKLKLNCENAEKSIQHIDIVLEILEHAAAPEAAANADSETIRQHAEAKLRQAIYPWVLPFDAGHAAITAYLAKLGASRGRLLALLSASAPAHRAAEALTTPIAQTGESSTDSQWALLTEQRRGARLWAAYGFVQESDIAISDPASGEFLSNQTVQEVLTRVSFLIERTGLSLEELEEALKTAFVAGYEWGMQLSGREQCKTSAMRLPAEGQVLEEILDRLHRFTRLRAKFLGWSITQLNEAIVLCGGSETPSTTDAERAGLLIKLTTLARLHDEFGLALAVLLENPFSEGRLRQALGLSLLQFGLLKEMTGLDLSAQAVDWPALEDFCKTARRLRDIGLAVEQGAQALLTRGRWQAVAGELPPEMKSSAQLETLLEAVRQRLRAVVEVAPELAIETQAVEALNNIFDVTRAGKIISAIHDASGPTRSAPNATMLAELLATLSGAAGHRLGEWLPLLDAASAAELFSVAATANPGSNERFTRLLVAIAARRRERELLAVLSEQCQLETAEVASLLGARLLLDAAPGEPVLAHEAFLDNNFWADGALTQATPRLQTWMDRLYRLLTLRAALGIDSQMMAMAERVVVDTNAGSNTGINWRDLLGAAPATGGAAWQNPQWQALLDLLWLQQPEQLGRPALDELLRRLGASGAQLVANTLRPMTARLDIAETLALPLVAQALDLPSGATLSGDPLLNPQKLRLAFEWMSIARQLGASASQMAQLMNPASNALAAATSKQLLEAKLSGDAVPGSLQKIGDALRRQRRDALVAYHVAQVVGRNNSDKWKDAKALYEHFLIDPQMEPCFATTRLLEAVSAVQLFAQRILFGIEPQITADRELKQRWVWMRNYRVWEANRKVFLFPENWLFPELRDDKSTSFKQLESALGQGELNQELANQTFGQFLDDVSQMGQVQVLGMYEDLSRDASGTLLKDRNNRYPLRRTLYVIGRTPNLPYAYFWRHCVDFGSPDMAWLPWQRIELDIQGDHVLPFVLGGNLCVAWPLIRRITQEAAEDSWEVKLAWSRHDGKAWRKTSVSREAWSDKASPFGDEREGFAFRCEATPDGSKSKIIVYVASEVAGTAISKPPTLQNIGGTPGFVLGDDFRPYRASDGVAPSSVRLAKLLDDGYDHIPNVVNANTYSPKQHLIVYAMINAYWGSDGTIGGGANPLYADMFKNSIHGDRIIFSNPALAIRQHFDALRNDPNLVIPTDIFIKQQIGTFISDYMDYSRSKTNYVAFNGFITALDPACAHADVQCEVWLRVTSGRSDLVKLRGDEGVFSCLIENSNLTPRDSIQFTKLGAITERPVTLTLTIDGRPLDSISETLGAVSPGFQSSKKLVFEVNGRSLSREQLDRIGVNISSQQSLVNVAEFDLPRDGFIKKMPGSRSPLLSQVANSRPWMNGIQESRLGPSWPFALARNGAADTVIFAATGSPGFWAVGSASSYPHDQLPPSWHYAEDDKAACYIDFASAAEGRSTDGLYVFPDTYKESAVRYSSWLESNELPAPQESTFGAIALPLPAVGNSAVWDAVKGGDRTFDARLPYACYNWEVFFHAPLLVADQLSKQHKFEDAERWLRCVFDPTSGGPEANSDRFLKFQVFKDLYLKRQVIDDLTALAQAAGGFATESDIEGIQKLIDRWRDTPFRPFVIARRRQIAFLWRTLFAYLDNLLAWADSLYRRDTRESINEATMLYVLAERILGQRPQVHQGTSNRPAVSYDEKISKGDEFANFWIDVGGYSQSNRPTGWRPKDLLEQPNPDGMLYFCMPFNDKILSYWNTVDARLGNIRNCRNIEGITRSLPFMDAPIDPELLVRATAAGLDLGEVIAGLYAPPPHYRYNVLASRAAELVNEARSLGAAMLSAIEKRDAEHLAQLRSSNEINLLKLVGDVRKLQITEASGNIEALRASRRSISARYGQYQRLLGNKDIKTPKENESAGEEAMLGTVDSGLASARSNWGLIKEEDQQYFGIEGANTWSLAANIAKFTGGGFHMAASILAPNPLDKITNAAEVAKAIGTASSLVGDGFSMV
ncbi:MAG TPA: neuraminidase-like domain-containing protein, partial [Azonexus sp.]|nr:neuraminidase-like domain-containing protein [Azonexus sp.]